jgi:hypothetical protein
MRLTPRLRREALCTKYASIYIVLQLAERTAIIVANNTGGLLHHLLTLIPQRRTVFFFSVIIPSRVSFISKVQIPALSGLSSEKSAIERPTFSFCKDNVFYVMIIICLKYKQGKLILFFCHGFWFALAPKSYSKRDLVVYFNLLLTLG